MRLPENTYCMEKRRAKGRHGTRDCSLSLKPLGHTSARFLTDAAGFEPAILFPGQSFTDDNPRQAARAAYSHWLRDMDKGSAWEILPRFTGEVALPLSYCMESGRFELNEYDNPDLSAHILIRLCKSADKGAVW
jgi:hypothetical protein